jgi:hypothetical protein
VQWHDQASISGLPCFPAVRYIDSLTSTRCEYILFSLFDPQIAFWRTKTPATLNYIDPARLYLDTQRFRIDNSTISLGLSSVEDQGCKVQLLRSLKFAHGLPSRRSVYMCRSSRSFGRLVCSSINTLIGVWTTEILLTLL